MSSNTVMRFEPLSKDNYDTWKMQMEALLIRNDEWGYIDGTLPKPETQDESMDSLKKWRINDSKAKADIILAICPTELKQIKGCKTARDVWIKLEAIYQSKGPARKATLLKSLILNKMQEGEDVRAHTRKFFDAVDKLQDMDVDINPELLSILLLYSLPQNFENFRCAIESRDELPSPEALRVKVIEENDARKQDVLSTVQNAMVVNKYSGNKFRFRCFRCKRMGHKAANCDWNNKEADYVAENTENVSLTAESAKCIWEKERKMKWCLDSGCTSHMSKNLDDFESIVEAKSMNLNLANCTSTKVNAEGTVKFIADTGIRNNEVTLNKTLHVPDLRTNLISVGKITEKNLQVVFRKNIAEVVDEAGSVKVVADRIGDLYYVREGSYVNCNVAGAYSCTKIEKWHRRLGHLNIQSIREAHSKCTMQGMDLKNEVGDFKCEICLRAKMTKKAFPVESNRKTEILEIVHTDVCGPMRVESKGRKLYFVTFIDDATKWSEVFFMRRKDEVFEKFKEFRAMAENFSGKRIKYLQSDNGGEYLNREFENYLKLYGIRRRLAVAYNPEQNGVAERKNRTLLEMARCLLIGSGMPTSFWAEAIHTANYIRNRCPTSSLKGKTPHEKWIRRVPNVKYFHEFGCDVFVLNKRHGRGKFEERGKKGIFIGYSETSKAFRIWIPEERNVIVTRDVKFVESMKENVSGSQKLESLLECEEGFTDETGRRTILAEIQSVEETPGRRFADAPSHRTILAENQPVEDTQNRNVATEDEEQASTDGGEADAVLLRRGPGRPTKVLTGFRGRPKKQYQTIQANEDEFAMAAEVPLNQALGGPIASEWLRAMATELNCIIEKDTWEIVERPKNRKTIGSRFVLRNKYGADGNLEKRKARIVAQGFSQRPGIDFEETFSPVARLSSIRILAALAASHGMKIRQFDVTAAYLNGTLNEEILMEVPEPLDETLNCLIKAEPYESNIRKKAEMMLIELRKGNRVCHLKKALYGLRQAGRQWNKRLNEALERFGATPSDADPCTYITMDGEDTLIITAYVDDLLVASKSERMIGKLKDFLMNEFEIRDLGEVGYCLGIEFKRTGNQISLCQRGYVQDVLSRFGMSESNPVSTPMDLNSKLTRENDSSDTEDKVNIPYRQLIGALMYLAVATRPDIAYAVNYLSQFNDCFGRRHWIAAKRVLRYLKGTANIGIVFDSSETLKGYVDADWGNDESDRKSYTGYIFTLSGGAISWKSKKQATVALSSTEAEYMGLTEAAKEAIYLRKFLKEINPEDLEVVDIYNDNLGAHKLAQNPVFHNRTKHIDIRHHFIREVLDSGQIKLQYCPTEEMPADVLTKGLPGPRHAKCVKQFGMKIIESNVPFKKPPTSRGEVLENETNRRLH